MANLNEEFSKYKVSNHLTPTYRRELYPAISPDRPELSQAGKTVLVTGATGGTGGAIARAFGRAGAAKVVVVGRDLARSQATAKALQQEVGGATVYQGRACQVPDPARIDAFWDGLAADGVTADVLVLNAAKLDVAGRIWDLGWEAVWPQFEVNVRSLLHMAQRFRQQPAPATTTTTTTTAGQRYIVNISTSAIHDFVGPVASFSYGLTKNSGTLLLQLLADESARAKEPIQIVSIHPGAVLTPAARKHGLDENTLPWDDETLPAGASVWAASPQAAFMHGRFLWASWDVDELATGALRKRIDEDSQYLRIGVHGL